jgi:rhodanese-related sulfurtransferase/rubrerythrin
MNEGDVRAMAPDELRSMMAKWDEEAYLLVDVRQPSEYTEGHIPGATLLPLMDLQTKVFDLPGDRELIFYCHSGGRSAFAADLAVEAEVTERGVYNLAGGIMAWDGRMVEDYPRVQVFDKRKSSAELLMTAMNLEKGAFRFYTYVGKKFAGEPYAKTLQDLSRAEEGHARTIYRFWERTAPSPKPFEALFAGLDGEILEGGMALKTLMDQADRVDPAGRNPCMALMELAMAIEHSAYDLYRAMAVEGEDSAARDAFWRIAQAEKAHMRMLARAIPECAGS